MKMSKEGGAFKIRVYIAGPITGNPDYMKEFDEAEKLLSQNNYLSVVNPAKLSAMLPKDFKWHEYMEVDLELLRHCDAIYMLDGWEQSEGARIERSIALGKGMRVMHQYEKNCSACAFGRSKIGDERLTCDCVFRYQNPTETDPLDCCVYFIPIWGACTNEIH